MTLDHLIGYLNTWSAVKHFVTANGFNPVEEVHKQLKQHWKTDTLAVDFPLLLRIGKIDPIPPTSE